MYEDELGKSLGRKKNVILGSTELEMYTWFLVFEGKYSPLIGLSSVCIYVYNNDRRGHEF